MHREHFRVAIPQVNLLPTFGENLCTCIARVLGLPHLFRNLLLSQRNACSF